VGGDHQPSNCPKDNRNNGKEGRQKTAPLFTEALVH